MNAVVNTDNILLEPFEEAFAALYVQLNGDAGLAYHRARQEVHGVAPKEFSRHHSSSAGASLLRQPHIRRRIQQITAEVFDDLYIDARRVKAEIALLAFGNAQDMFDSEGALLPIIEMPRSVATAISSFEVEGPTKRNPNFITKVKRVDKMAALTLLAKHFKLVGEENEGVNKLASALADRLNAAKQRVPTPRQPAPLQDVEEIPLRDTIEAARVFTRPAQRPVVYEPTPAPTPTPTPTLQESDDDPIW